MSPFYYQSQLNLKTCQYSGNLTFEAVDKILKYDHSNKSNPEQYLPVEVFIMLFKVAPTIASSRENSTVSLQMKALQQYFPVLLFIILYKVSETVILAVCYQLKQLKKQPEKNSGPSIERNVNDVWIFFACSLIY